MLYRDAASGSLEVLKRVTLSSGAVAGTMAPCDTDDFGGSNALDELWASILDSGIDPVQFDQHPITHAGVEPTSPVVSERVRRLHGLALLYNQGRPKGEKLARCGAPDTWHSGYPQGRDRDDQSEPLRESLAGGGGDGGQSTLGQPRVRRNFVIKRGCGRLGSQAGP